MNMYAIFDQNIPCGSRVMNIFIKCYGTKKNLSIKKCGFASQWLGNDNMHDYAKLEQNIPCGSRAMNIFTNCYGSKLMFSEPSSI